MSTPTMRRPANLRASATAMLPVPQPISSRSPDAGRFANSTNGTASRLVQRPRKRS
jgi:hypothetical protein